MSRLDVKPDQRIRFKESLGRNWKTVEIKTVVHYPSATLVTGWRVVRGTTTSVIGKANHHGEYDLTPKCWALFDFSVIEGVNQ